MQLFRAQRSKAKAHNPMKILVRSTPFCHDQTKENSRHKLFIQLNQSVVGISNALVPPAGEVPFGEHYKFGFAIRLAKPHHCFM